MFRHRKSQQCRPDDDQLEVVLLSSRDLTHDSRFDTRTARRAAHQSVVGGSIALRMSGQMSSLGRARSQGWTRHLLVQRRQALIDGGDDLAGERSEMGIGGDHLDRNARR